MSRMVRGTARRHTSFVHRTFGLRGVFALSAAVLSLAAAPTVARADTIVGSNLAGPPTITKSATVDSVYWAALLGDNVNGAMPSAGTVKSVTIRGYYAGGGYPTIFIQVLRPQPDGSVLVVATSQPFTLSSTPGTYTFEPTNMTVQAGDYIGIATIGGNFVIGTAATGALTNDFSGHNQDMNGDTLKTTATEPNVELLVRVDLVPATVTPPPPPGGGPGGKPPAKKTPKKTKPKAKACKCKKIKVLIDPTLLNKRHLRPDQHNFGVGFTWRMTCSKGKGGCTGTLKFEPPQIRAGSLPKQPGLKLNLETLSFVCKTTCNTSTTGRFELKMKSPEQLNKLFGRTLAFTITTKCSGVTKKERVNVFVDSTGRLHPSH